MSIPARLPEPATLTRIATGTLRSMMLHLGYPPDSCIAACALTTRVLAYYGIRACPVAVEIAVLNDAAWNALTATSEPPSAWPDGAYALGWNARHPGASPGDTGHLTLHAPACGLFIDPTLDQYSRPSHGITLHAPLVAPATPPTSTAAPLIMTKPGGVRVLYTPSASTRWRDSPDWAQPPHGNVITGATIRAVNTRLRNPTSTPNPPPRPEEPPGCPPSRSGSPS